MSTYPGPLLAQEEEETQEKNRWTDTDELDQD